MLLRKLKKKITVSDHDVKGFFVQVGSFSNEFSAKEMLEKTQKFSKGMIEVNEGERKLYRALLGPFKTKASAQKVLKKVVSAGHEAVLKKNK